MKDYKSIISAITEAVAQIVDPHLKELAFQRLMEDALGGMDATSPKKSADAGSSRRDKTMSHGQTPREPYHDSSIRKEVKQTFEVVDPNFPGMKPFKTFKQKWQKYVWILEFGRQKGIDLMTNGEIAYVLNDIFHESTTDANVGNLKTKFKDGYVQSRMQGKNKAWKIMQPGIDLISAASQHETHTNPTG